MLLSGLPKRRGRRLCPRPDPPAAEILEDRTLLAAPNLLPDLVVWADQREAGGFSFDWELEQATQSGRELLRLTAAIANVGDGPLELRAEDPNAGGAQPVHQRIYHADGSFSDRLAGEWDHHEAHGHTHFEEFAQYNLRSIAPNGGLGDVVAGGFKTSFALMDARVYDVSLPAAAEHWVYADCLIESITSDCDRVQGISVGWADVYEKRLPGQSIDITGVPDGEYWLEIVVDPEDRIRESNELNNSTQVLVRLERLGDALSEQRDSVPREELGRVEFRTIEGILAGSERRILRLQAAHDGLLTLELTQRDQPPDLQTIHYEVESGRNIIDPGNRTDVQVAGGESLLVFLRGLQEPSPFSMRLTNLVGIDGSVMIVHGTRAADLIELGQGSDDPRLMSINGVHYEPADFEGAKPTAIRIATGPGDDTVRIGPLLDMPAWINGQAGNDSLSGGSGDDRLLGGAGRDHLDGGAGRDRLMGHAGNDRLRGGLDDDRLDAGTGSDLLFEEGDAEFRLSNQRLTGTGRDVLSGFERARIVGGSGDNQIDASAFTGRVTLDGGAGDDLLIGGLFADRLNGQAGQDTLLGGAGDDRLLGGAGRDVLAGESGNDRLDGQGGRDRLAGGDGRDRLQNTDGEVDESMQRGQIIRVRSTAFTPWEESFERFNDWADEI